MNTRTITDHHRKVAKNIKDEYEKKKRELKLTQTKMAEQLGMRQAAISQYMNGAIATNLEVVLKFAAILEVAPEQLDPELLRQTNFVIPRQKRCLPVRHAIEGSPSVDAIELSVIRTNVSTDAYAVECNTPSYQPFIKAGTFVIVDPELEPEVNDMVFIQTTMGNNLLASLTCDAEDVLHFRGMSGEDISIRQDQLTICDVVIGSELPVENRKKRQ